VIQLEKVDSEAIKQLSGLHIVIFKAHIGGPVSMIGDYLSFHYKHIPPTSAIVFEFNKFGWLNMKNYHAGITQ